MLPLHFAHYKKKICVISSCQILKYKDIELRGVEINNKKCGNMLELYKYKPTNIHYSCTHPNHL